MPKPADLGPGVRELTAAAGKALMELGFVMAGTWDWSVAVTGFSVRAPQSPGGDFLITIRALDHEGGPVVAWHGSPELGNAIQGLHNRLRNGSLKWRADEWARK